MPYSIQLKKWKKIYNLDTTQIWNLTWVWLRKAQGNQTKCWQQVIVESNLSMTCLLIDVNNSSFPFFQKPQMERSILDTSEQGLKRPQRQKRQQKL